VTKIKIALVVFALVVLFLVVAVFYAVSTCGRGSDVC
jgi:hypothetical protein